MTLVRHRLTTPSGQPLRRWRITARLVAPAGLLADSTGQIIESTQAVADVDGWCELELTPQSKIAGIDTYYAVRVDGQSTPLYCVVPDAGPVQLSAILVDPTTLNPVPLPPPSLLVVDTDPRLSDARTPTLHAASHATDGSDPITPASIGALEFETFDRFGSNYAVGDPTAAPTTAQIDADLAKAQIFGPRPLLLMFHIAYDTAGVLRIAQHGFNTTTHAEANVDRAVSALTATGFPIYGIKVHQSGITADKVTAQFWTDYRALVGQLATKYAPRTDTRYFFVTNEFESATGNTTNTTALQNLIADVRALGYKAGMCFNSLVEASRCVVVDNLDGVGVNVYPSVSTRGAATTPEQVMAAWERYGAAEYFRYRKSLGQDCFITEVGTTDKAYALEYTPRWNWGALPDNNGAIVGPYWEGVLRHLIEHGDGVDLAFGYDQGIFDPYKFASSLAVMRRYAKGAQL